MYQRSQWKVSVAQYHGLWATRLLWPWNSPGKNTGVGSQSLPSPEIFLTQGWNLGLLHGWQILYCLSHQGFTELLSKQKSLNHNLFDPPVLWMKRPRPSKMDNTAVSADCGFLSPAHHSIFLVLLSLAWEADTVTQHLILPTALMYLPRLSGTRRES